MTEGFANRADNPQPRDEVNDLLWEVSTYVEAIGENALKDTPLTLAAAGMLCLVRDEPGITIAEISRRVPKSPQALGQVAGRLRKLGLVERQLRDAPGIGLHVTDQGRKMADVASVRERGVTEQLHELLGKGRYERLRELLSETRDLFEHPGGPEG